MVERNISRLALILLVVMAARCGAQSDEELAALCSQIGVVPHPSECTKYVTCATGQGGFVARERSCGANLAFDGTSCVPISQVPGCYAPIARRSLIAAADIDECGKVLFSCKDCKTVRRCFKNNLGEYYNPQFSPCPAATPFCDSGVCSSVQTPSCRTSQFRCSDVGIFPDPTNCRYFFFCDGLKPTPVDVRMCGAGEFASSTVNDCVKSTECPTTLCPAGFTGFQAYTKDPRYFLYCDPADPSFKYDMYKCPFEERFDMATKVCKSICLAAGKMADPKAISPAEHFVCTGPGAPAPPLKSTCITGQVFDPSVNRCELASQAKVCALPNIPPPVAP